jgi:hypothetical protein
LFDKSCFELYLGVLFCRKQTLFYIPLRSENDPHLHFTFVKTMWLIRYNLYSFDLASKFLWQEVFQITCPSTLLSNKHLLHTFEVTNNDLNLYFYVCCVGNPCEVHFVHGWVTNRFEEIFYMGTYFVHARLGSEATA